MMKYTSSGFWRLFYGRFRDHRKFRGLILIIILLTFWLLLRLYSVMQTQTISQISSINVYKRAERLRINGAIDPPCGWSIKHNTYVCAGHCLWVTTKIVKCDFLPRIVNTHFQQNQMYCTPPPDNCLSINAWLKDSLPPTLNPVHTVPNEILSNFTLNGLIPVNYNIGFQFVNYSGSMLNWSVEYVSSYRNQVKERKPFGTYVTTALYPVLEAYSDLAVRNKSCAVIGSEYPWIEAALLEFQATVVTTIEYNRIVTNVPNLRTITPNAFASAQQRNAIEEDLQLFDSVWCYSSIEHDGLGRYTDPLNPYGDLQTMIKISCMLKPGGLLFLAVPTNKYDSIHFNLHRVYGRIRLPLLYRYFHLVQVFGDGFAMNPDEYTWQPVLVLQNKIGCK